MVRSVPKIGYFIQMSLAGSISILLLSAMGCAKKETADASVTNAPQKVQHWDVGDQIIKHTLPPDIADGYLEFAKASGFGFGVTLAHSRISKRSHERSDLLIYVHTGTGRFQVGEKELTVSTGDLLFVPRGTAYSAESLSRRQLELVTVYSPPLDKDDVKFLEPAEKVADLPKPATLPVKVTMGDTTGMKAKSDSEFLKMQDYQEDDEGGK